MRPNELRITDGNTFSLESLEQYVPAGIAECCHSYYVPLIVDEAHGAHFGLHSGFPQSAMQQGADISVQSTHKTLTSMGQSSMLHCQGNLVDRTQLGVVLRMLQVSLVPSTDLMVHRYVALIQGP